MSDVVAFSIDDVAEGDLAPPGAGGDCDGTGGRPNVKAAVGVKAATAADRGWGPGWPSCQTAGIRTVVCGGSGLRLPVRVEIAPLVAGLVAALEAARGRPFRPDWSWGFACRPVRGTRSPSNHSWGLAVDLDAPENPMLTTARHRAAHPLRRTYPGGLVLRSTMPADTARIATRWGFGWGGLYGGRPDPMHFELLVDPHTAARLVGRLSIEPREEDDMPTIDEIRDVIAKEVAKVLRSEGVSGGVAAIREQVGDVDAPVPYNQRKIAQAVDATGIKRSDGQ